ncbi:hypothetical protein EUGRSUZ_A01906 [Eucalyptus grandis]|uniref:Uncharacterized protein n=2 Tax=Eucalyptus grandis TaxID=71139 RepID=A0ACC3M5H8_EUCGR|nr:hypothetical protein EUGRSUZ_A01906 [Eucalyptus grandis]
MKLNPKDRISSLPEDVIGYILSLLTLREAQATCLLSKRWRQLSTRHVTNLDYLDFDWSDLLRGMKANPEIAEKERARYVEWVDNVVHCQSGRDHTLHGFTICFDLNFSCKSHIDRWIKFALAKRVKVLHLNFEPVYKEDLIDGCLPYPLGHETIMDADVGCLQQSSDLSKVGLSPSIPWHVGFRYLEELHLKRVIVDGKLIEQLLANSPVLERLTLDDARTLNRLRVAGQSLKLKYLCVACCFDLECIEICDMDLVSFTFVGLYSLLSMDKLPQLHEVSLSGCISILRNDLPQLSSLPCLQILELEFDYSHPAHLAIPSELPKLTSVKQLKLRVGGSGDISLLPLTIVIEACPYLRSFVFEYLLDATIRVEMFSFASSFFH